MNEAQLKADVCQSQSIERMYVDENSLRFGLHLKAAQYVYDTASRGEWPHVTFVHYQIMTKDDDPGMIRTWPVYVAESKDAQKHWCPAPSHVPALMADWEHACSLVRSNPAYFDKYLENACLNQYYHFLTIHPFSDGNGRTGRLMYNALRLLVGLPWHTFTCDVHDFYVDKLRQFEAEFKSHHPEVYDPNLV